MKSINLRLVLGFLIVIGLMALLGGCAAQQATQPLVMTKTVAVIPQIPVEHLSPMEPCVLPKKFTNEQIGQCYRSNLMLIDGANERAQRLRGYLDGLRAAQDAEQ